MTPTLAAVLIVFALAAVAAFRVHARRGIARAGTVPGAFPPVSVMIPGEIAVANKLGNTAGIASTVFFQAPVAGYYALGWKLHIESTDGTGSLAAAVSVPGAPNIPGVQPILGTPADGQGPFAPYWLNVGAQVSVAVTPSGLGTTSYDFWVFAQKLN